MYRQYIETKLFRGLDGLRFLSIFGVVWHHSPSRTGLLHAEGYGFLGVDLFFVISGFLIVTLLLREREAQGDISLRSFYMRRMLRIFPLYYGLLIALTIWYATFGAGSTRAGPFFDDLPVYLLYLANTVPVGLRILWSLASEEQFYIVWPFIEKYVRGSIYPILIFALLINQIVNFNRSAIAAALDMPHLDDLEIMQATFTPILLGVGLAHLLHRPESFARLQRILGPAYASVAWLTALVIGCSLLPSDISGGPRLCVQLLMTLLVGSVVIRNDGRLIPLLAFAPIVRVGAISYGIYLFHLHCLAAADKVLRTLDVEFDHAVFLLGFLLSIAVAELSYRFYETPFLRLKARFSVVSQRHA